MALAVRGDKRFRFGVRQVLNTLLGLEMEFDPHTIIAGVNHRERVAAEQVHVAERPWNSAVGHDNGHLMQCFR